VDGFPDQPYRLVVLVATLGRPATQLMLFRRLEQAHLGWYANLQRDWIGLQNTPDKKNEFFERVYMAAWELYPDRAVQALVHKQYGEDRKPKEGAQDEARAVDAGGAADIAQLFDHLADWLSNQRAG
jgi:hypothetical protein